MDIIKFRLEDRIECGESHKVKYMYRDEYTLSLPVPLDKAINLCKPYQHSLPKLQSGFSVLVCCEYLVDC